MLGVGRWALGVERWALDVHSLLPAARRDAVALPRFALTRWPAARRWMLGVGR